MLMSVSSCSCLCSFVKGLRDQGAFKVETVILPDGEEHKSLQVLQQVWDKALKSRLDRKATFVALGGGVIGDMTGFAAAAYQRGASFIQVYSCMLASLSCNQKITSQCPCFLGVFAKQGLGKDCIHLQSASCFALL